MRRFLVQADGAGAWSLRVPELGLGESVAQARVLGRGGAFASLPSPAATIVAEHGLTIDAPVAPVRGYLPSLTGTAHPGATVRLTIDGADLRETTAGVGGAWSIALADIVAGGTYWLSVWQETPLRPHAPVVLTFTVEPYLDATWAVLHRWEALGVKASKAREEALDTLLLGPLTSTGLLAKLDALYTPQHAATAARVNLKAPAADLLTLVNSPTIVVDRYFQGDGVTSYFEIPINPAVDGGNYQLDSAAMGVWSVSNVQNVSFDMGNGNAARLRGRAPGLMGAGANASTFQTTPAASSLGFYGWTRRDSAGFDFFRGPAVVATVAQPSSAIPNGRVQLGAFVGINHSSRRYTASFLSGGLTAQNIADFHAILSAWLAHLGAV